MQKTQQTTGIRLLENLERFEGDGILYEGKVSKNKRSVVCTIASFSDLKKKVCTASNATIAKHSGVSPRTVKRIIAELESNGIIMTKRAFGKYTYGSTPHPNTERTIYPLFWEKMKKWPTRGYNNNYNYTTAEGPGLAPVPKHVLVSKNEAVLAQQNLRTGEQSNLRPARPVSSSNPRHSLTPSLILTEGLNPTPRPGYADSSTAARISNDFSIFEACSYQRNEQSMKKTPKISDFYRQPYYESRPELIPASYVRKLSCPEDLRTLSHPELLYFVRLGKKQKVTPSVSQLKEQIEAFIARMKDPKHVKWAEKNRKNLYFAFVRWLAQAKEYGKLQTWTDSGLLFPDAEFSNGDGTHTIITDFSWNRQEVTLVDEDYEEFCAERLLQQNKELERSELMGLNKNQDEQINEADCKGIFGARLERVPSGSIFKEA